MYIAIHDLPITELKAFNGGEKQLNAHMFTDERNKILLGHLEPGASIGTHTHETSSEIMYFLTGSGIVICDGAEETVSVGGCHYCPKGSTHTLINNGTEELTFFAVVPQQ